LTFIFFRGVGQPPTRFGVSDFDVQTKESADLQPRGPNGEAILRTHKVPDMELNALDETCVKIQNG